MPINHPTVNGFQIEAVVLSPFLSEAKLRVKSTPPMVKEPKSRRHACPQCVFKTKNVSDLRKHVRAVHEKRRDHACSQCDAAFGQAGNLRTHVRTVHEQRRDHACPQCDAAFGEASTLRKHVRAVHEEHSLYYVPFKEGHWLDFYRDTAGKTTGVLSLAYKPGTGRPIEMAVGSIVLCCPGSVAFSRSAVKSRAGGRERGEAWFTARIEAVEAGAPGCGYAFKHTFADLQSSTGRVCKFPLTDTAVGPLAARCAAEGKQLHTGRPSNLWRSAQVERVFACQQ